VVARAQQPAMPVIGLLNVPGVPVRMELFLPTFNQGLADSGYAVGRNVTIESREGGDDPGCAKTKSDLVVTPSGGRIFAFFCSERDHKPQNSGCGYTVQSFHTAWTSCWRSPLISFDGKSR
jgi:hypothetical protein